MQIKDLSECMELIPVLAQRHYGQWGELTGAASEDDYQKILHVHASSYGVPATLLALEGSILLGSVNIVESDLDIRAELKPWLAQLYVVPEQRGRGIGSALVRAAIAWVLASGFDMFYLYTSGTLPGFYESLGWRKKEIVHFNGRQRTVM